MVAEFIQLLGHIHHGIFKLGLVGCSLVDRSRINRLMKKTGCLSSLPVKYFDDPEDAKTWLVSELA